VSDAKAIEVYTELMKSLMVLEENKSKMITTLDLVQNYGDSHRLQNQAVKTSKAKF